MKYTINLKYNIGDEVRYVGNASRGVYGSYWYGPVPEEDNHWKVDAYRVDIDENGICVKYCFHAYMNKYFEYHELVDEKDLEPISTPNPHAIEFEPKDVFGNPVEIGDIVNYGFYYVSNSVFGDPPEIRVQDTLAFHRRGKVVKFTKAKNTYWDDGERVEFTESDYESRVCKEHLYGVITKAPDTFAKDMAKVALERIYNDSDMEIFKTITSWFGKTDECLEAYERLKNQKEKGREYNRQRRTQKKSNPKKKKFDAKSILSSLSEKEKQELLKELAK